jgi:hypothetical protein
MLFGVEKSDNPANVLAEMHTHYRADQGGPEEFRWIPAGRAVRQGFLAVVIGARVVNVVDA